LLLLHSAVAFDFVAGITDGFVCVCSYGLMFTATFLSLAFAPTVLLFGFALSSLAHTLELVW
jgi:hypothetical protein